MDSRARPRRLRRSLTTALAALVLLSARADATWSLVAVDTRTGEVGVACATCLPGFQLTWAVPVIMVGKGAAAAQSYVDTTCANRKWIRRGLIRDLEPVKIVHLLARHDHAHQTRQYGIATLHHPPATFTGAFAGQGKHGVAGISGDFRYAIQGNVLTGPEVVTAAEAAFLSCPGDLSQRLMAGMQAARALGGDGRCSCNPNAPTSCGVPPPDFTKSAHTTFLLVAREGDSDGLCGNPFGCAQGEYFLRLNVVGNWGHALDPVLKLQRRYNFWRADRADRPDHVRSTVTASTSVLESGSGEGARVIVRLRDIEGAALTWGGGSLRFEPGAGSDGVTTVGPVQDEGEGRYALTVFAGDRPGSDGWRIWVTDGDGEVLLRDRLDFQVL